MPAAGNELEYRHATLRLVDRAQRFRQAVVRAAIRDHRASVARRDEGSEARIGKEWQVAGDDEPGVRWMGGLRGRDPGDRADVFVFVIDCRMATACLVTGLATAHGNEDLLAMPAEALACPVELRAAVITQGGLVLAHAPAGAARQDQPKQRRVRRGHGRAAPAPTSRLPPCLATRRVSTMVMSCESALHMS